MNLEQAKAFLNTLTREELRDHAFGDCEVFWMRGEQQIACGYFGGSDDPSVGIGSGADYVAFSGNDAEELRYYGTVGRIERNDSTGPDDFHEGECLPGLTIDGVLREITEEKP